MFAHRHPPVWPADHDDIACSLVTGWPRWLTAVWAVSHCSCPPLTSYLTAPVCYSSISFTLSYALCLFTTLSPSGPLLCFYYQYTVFLVQSSLCFSLHLPYVSVFCIFSQSSPGGPCWETDDNSCISSWWRGHFRSSPLRHRERSLRSLRKKEESGL